MIKSGKESGFSLVEIIISFGIFSVVIFAIAQLLLVSQEAAALGKEKVKATAMLSEYLEELKNIRRQNWESLINGRYIIRESSGNLELEASTEGEIIENFTRYLEIAYARRDQNENLVASGGEIDPSTKKIAVTVSWTSLHPSSISQETCLTRFLDNLAWTQSTVTEFDEGEMVLVEIVNPVINDGEVQLRGGCEENPEGGLIYNEQFHNTWQIHPSALADIKEVGPAEGEVFEGNLSLSISDFNGTSTKLRNGDTVCTIGFTNVEFQAYNDAAITQSFKIGGKWEQEFSEVVLPPQSWQLISIPYGDLSGGDEVNFDFIFFREGDQYQAGTKFYVDNMALSNGFGGFYATGTLTSSVLDTGRSSVFNRISFNGEIPVNTQIGLQTASSDSPTGPWIFYGPGGTSLDDDLYTTPEGEGVLFGGNIGQYFQYKAYLKSFDGQETPILYDVSVNYSP